MAAKILSGTAPVCLAGLLMLQSLAGCGAGTSSVDLQLANEKQSAELIKKPFGAPLTDEEISLFLSILNQLPGGHSPDFAESELTALQLGPGLPSQIERMRMEMRDSLHPDEQGKHWNARLDLNDAFHRINVSPAAFAALTLRISCAWSAATISSETRFNELRHRIELQLAELTVRLRVIPESQWDLNQKRTALEDLVALSEFLKLIEMVPEESVAAVMRRQTELRDAIPSSGLVPQLSREKSRGSGVQPVSWETRR